MILRDRILLFFSVLLCVLGVLFVVQSTKLKGSRLVFCDVGQGDAIFFVSESGKQVLVDGGPGSRVLDCLSAQMPFWDRSLDMLVLSHPQKDHMEGLLSVLERYSIRTIAGTGVGQKSSIFGEWERLVAEEGAVVHQTVSGDRFVLGRSVYFDVLWPTLANVSEWKSRPPGDLNETSVVLKLKINDVCAYLTGDIPKEVLATIVDEACEVFKVSHHGSKTGTNLEILEKAKPRLVVIQVGRNSYGHPTTEVLNLLGSKGIEIFRTDKDGLVEMMFDKKDITVRTEK
jgi:competence protein ComEC